MLQIVMRRVDIRVSSPHESCGLMSSETDYRIYNVTGPIEIYRGNAIFFICRFIDIINRN